MKLTAFRIRNYRSISDSGWCRLSLDNITTLIGPNESGKTSMLEALEAFQRAEIKQSAVRIDGSSPEVLCTYSFDSVKELTSYASLFVSNEVIDAIRENGLSFTLSRQWTRENLESSLDLVVPALNAGVEDEEQPCQENQEEEEDDQWDEEDDEPDQKNGEPDTKALASGLFVDTPELVFFYDHRSILPDKIDLSQLADESAQGVYAALSFLRLAGVDIAQLSAADDRRRESLVKRTSRELTADFREYWTQNVGLQQVSLEFDVKNYPQNPGAGKAAGAPYLIFWVVEGSEALHPSQRSKGLIWFLSLYLQLKAESAGERELVFMIDEPGLQLHATAQEDLLRVLESLRDRMQIIYTTHSPYLVPIDNLFSRVLVVQRDEDGTAATVILTPRELGSANRDSLTPIYTAMGMRLSHQQNIPRFGNVLLEEISCYYYLKAFFRLSGEDDAGIFLLPCTGVTNIKAIANLLLGWGLSFSVLVDDDRAGRREAEEIRNKVFANDMELASKRIGRVRGCAGIEDVFSAEDFRRFVLKDENAALGQKNAEHMRTAKKAATALAFYEEVMQSRVALEDLNSESRDRILSLVQQVQELAEATSN